MANDTSHPEGAAGLDPDEAAGLKPGLTTRAELNAFEQTNIAQGVAWAMSRRKLKLSLFTIDSIKFLHRRMFDDTWHWAGCFRTTGKNIGAEPHLSQTQLAILCADGNYWIENNTYPVDECAVRIHHRVVSIHPFLI